MQYASYQSCVKDVSDTLILKNYFFSIFNFSYINDILAIVTTHYSTNLVLDYDLLIQ